MTLPAGYKINDTSHSYEKRGYDKTLNYKIPNYKTSNKSKKSEKLFIPIILIMYIIIVSATGYHKGLGFLSCDILWSTTYMFRSIQ